MFRKKCFLFVILGIVAMTLFSCQKNNVDESSNKRPPVYEGIYVIESTNKKNASITAGITDGYFVYPEDEFIVQIKLDNPDSVEIQSFTLEGVKYSNYMFEAGSDLENLYLRLEAPSESGSYEYTLDAIKYIDGEEIKDVTLDKNTSVTINVRETSAPVVSDLMVGTTSTTANISFILSDTKGLIVNKNAKLVILDQNDEEILSNSIEVGTNSINIDNLIMGNAYSYQILAEYDKINGEGLQLYTIESGTFNTTISVSLNVDTVTDSSIVFSVIDSEDVGNIKAINLYKTDTHQLVASLANILDRQFDNLLSNNNYQIEVVYEYGSNHELILAKSATTDVSSTKESISFSLSKTDLNNLITIKEIGLYLNDEFVTNLDDFSKLEFSGLLSKMTSVN